MQKSVLCLILLLYCFSQDFGTFLNRFENKNTEHIYYFKEDPRNKDLTFFGKKLPKEDLKYIEEDKKKSWKEFYSLYRIELSKDYFGLLLRVPSQYSISQVTLYIFSKKENNFLQKVSLADHFGDGYWYFYKDAWIKDFNNNGFKDLLIIQKDVEHHEGEENPDKEGEVKSIKFTYKFMSFDKNQFIEIENPTLIKKLAIYHIITLNL